MGLFPGIFVDFSRNSNLCERKKSQSEFQMNVLIRTVFAAMTRRSQLSDMFVVVVVLMPLSIHLCLEILKNLVHIELLTQFGYALGPGKRFGASVSDQLAVPHFF